MGRREGYGSTPDHSWELLPEGNYIVRVENAFIYTSPKGAEVWKLELKIKEDRYYDKELAFFCSMMEKMKPYRKHICKSLGLDIDKDIDLERDPIGKVGVAKIEHDTFTPEKFVDGVNVGKKRTVVKVKDILLYVNPNEAKVLVEKDDVPAESLAEEATKPEEEAW